MPKDPPFREAVQAFLKDLSKDLAITRGYVSPRTLASYRHRLAELGRYAARRRRLRDAAAPPGEQERGLERLRLSALCEDLLKDYLIDHLSCGNRPATLNTHLYTLKSFFRFASKRYGVPDATEDLERSRARPHRGVHLPDRHVEAFLDHMARREAPRRVKLRDSLFFEIVARYGTRISEALSLDLDSVTVTAHSIDLKILGKGNRPRVVPLPLYDEKGKIPGRDAFRELLREYLGKARARWKASAGHEKALFLSQKGSRWSDDAARAVFNAAMRSLGFKQFGYVVHSLRHSVASRLLNTGVGLPTVSRILGHASTQVTASIYAHADESEIEKGMTKTY